MTITETTIGNILTRTTGFLRTVTSHSLQPYRGCTFGKALCGVGCYVQHNRHLLAGRQWGEFLEVRKNAADSYREHAPSERRWATRRGIPFGIFCSSATDPFVPQEFRYGVTRSVLEAMCDEPPDVLILQTHSHRVADYLPLIQRLGERCRLRVHLSIESDRETLPGLPPPASPVERRFAACDTLRSAGIFTVVTVSPLLPISDPEHFFSRIAGVADAVVLDHFIQGDGSSDGNRTLRTRLPDAMRQVAAESVDLSYRDAMAAIAQSFMPSRVGVNIDGFAARWLPAPAARAR